MRLNMDRICQLAGIKSNSRTGRSGLIREGKGADHDRELDEMEEELENESFLYEDNDDDDDDDDD